MDEYEDNSDDKQYSNDDNFKSGNNSTDAYPNTDFITNFTNVCVETNMTHVQINRILSVLRQHECFQQIPKDARCLLKTPRKCENIKVIEPGRYLHIGIETNIITKLKNIDTEIPHVLLVDFSTDGANIYNNVQCDVWPIQFRIINISDKRPMIAGLYQGTKQPANFKDFFAAFKNEIIKLINTGFMYNGKNIKLQINAFIADTSAKHHCLNIKGHGGYYSCPKCKIPGERHKNDRTHVYIGIGYAPRTDEEFITFQINDSHIRNNDDRHHNGISAFHDLPMGLVSQVPIDYMHLVCLGVVKKILVAAWIDGKFKPRALNMETQRHISERLLTIAAYSCPKEFARLPRSLYDCHRF